MLERVGLRRAHDREGRLLALGIRELDHAANGDFKAVGSVDHLGSCKNGTNLVDAGGVLCLLFLCIIELRVLGKVAEIARNFDTLDDFVVLLALTVSKLVDKLLTALRGQGDCVFHALLSHDLVQGLVRRDLGRKGTTRALRRTWSRRRCLPGSWHRTSGRTSRSRQRHRRQHRHPRSKPRSR